MGGGRGGFGAKLHAAVNPLGNPVRFYLTGVNAADSPHLPALIAGIETDAVLADKGVRLGCQPGRDPGSGPGRAPPPQRKRTAVIEYDRHLYRERNAVERFFGRIEQHRRVATWHDKKVRNYLGFVWVAAIAIVLA